MERDDLIEYSLDTHHNDAQGKSIRKKIYKVTILLTAVTIIEVFFGALIKQDASIWPLVKWTFIALTLLKAGYIVMVFMHLGDEKKWLRYVILIPYFIFILYLVFIAIWESTYVKEVLNTLG